MTYRAKVERNTATALGAAGEELPAEWVTLHEALPCFAYTARGRTIARNPSIGSGGTGPGIIVHEAPALMVPMGTDINESDRINGISKRNGEIYRTGIMRIESIIEAHDHLEIALGAVA